MGIIRSHFTRLTKATLVASLGCTLVASDASAQGSEGNWGVEGRIVSGQSAYLLRWFNPNWSLVLGGGLSSSSTENSENSATNDINSGNLQALIRREFGTGRVHPFFSVGPQVSYSRGTNKIPSGGGTTESSSTTTGLGGRFEFGAFGSVSQAVDLGVVLGATGTRSVQKTKNIGSQLEGKSTTTAFTVGYPQFVIRVRF